MSRGRPRVRIQVWDSSRFAQTIDAVVAKRFAGNLSKAAKTIGIERSLLTRLRQGESKSLGRRDLARLRKALTRVEFADIERALVSTRAAEALAAFDGWVGAERDRWLYRDATADTEVGRAIGSVFGWEEQRMLEHQHLLSLLRNRFSRLFKDFDRWLQRREHSQSRSELAYIRILAPLLDCRESGCIERRWEELSDAELFRFIQAGIEREKVLMDRPPEVQRAQEIAEHDPVEFIALYGQLWDPRAFTGPHTNELIARWMAQRLRAT